MPHILQKLSIGLPSLQEFNKDFVQRETRKRKYRRTIDFAFWLATFLTIVAILSFNSNSFASRPVFGYSMYITKEDNSLLLVKNDSSFAKRLAYESEVAGRDIGIVKAEFPRLGSLVSFLADKVYLIFVLAGAWLVGCHLLDRQPSRDDGESRFHASAGRKEATR